MSKHITKTKLIVIITVLVSSLALLLLLSYNMLYSLTINYRDHQDKVSSDYTILDNRELTNENLVFIINTNELNYYINKRKILKSIELSNPNYSINAISLNTNDNEIYINLNKPNRRPFDITCHYNLSYLNDSLLFEINPISVGTAPSFVSRLFASSLKKNTLIIPLDTSDDDLFDSIFLEILNDEDILSTSLTLNEKESTVNLELELSNIDFIDNDITDTIITTPDIINENGDKIYFLTQSMLINDILNVDTLNQLTTIGINNAIKYNNQGDAYIRLYDDNSDFSFDTKITLNIEEQDNLTKTKVDKLTPLSKLINITDRKDITTIIGDALNNKTIPSLNEFEILDYQVTNKGVRFHVKQTSWTIMVYMNGSNLESGYDPYSGDIYAKATEDLEEMLSGLESDNINLIIETGGTLEWKMDGIRSDINQRFKVENGELLHLEDLEMKNMTTPETLIDFANYAIDEYPSEKYALLMWDHGGGSLYGFGVDEHFAGDSLTLDEFDVALASITSSNDMQFEVIGFDACLMATLETAQVCSPYSKYLIASEETEPDYGWDYERIFESLADGDAYDGDSFGELVVSGFIDYSVETNQEDMLTLSVLDLSKTYKVVQAMDKLVLAITNPTDSDEDSFTVISRVIPQIKAFGGNTESTGFTDHYDLENFAQKLTEYWPGEANELIAAIDSLVIYKASGYLATDAGGLSFYLPFYDLFYEDEIDEQYSPVSFSNTYTTFVETFVDYRLNSSFKTSDLIYSVNPDITPYELTISESSLNYVSNVYMNTFVYYEEDGLTGYIDLGFDAWVVETETPGVYQDSFSFWPSIDNTFLPIQVVYHGDDYIEYETPIYLNGKQATMISGWLFEEERYVIFGARPYLYDTSGIVDRNTIEFMDGDVIEVLYDTFSDDSNEWTFEPLLTIDVDLDSFEIKDLEFGAGSFAIQFVIEDYNGDLTFTDFLNFELPE